MPQRPHFPLAERARELFGIELGRGECERFDRYLDLLGAWSKSVNLISVRTRGEIVDRHLLDSIAPLRFVRGTAIVADFGSGAGFPAVPLAILAPATRFFLVEPRNKRATFLRHVARNLDLANVRVYEERGEEWVPGEKVDMTIGRAVRPDLLGELSLRVLSPAGRLVLMRKRNDRDLRITGFSELERAPYDLPGGEQHEIVVLRRTSCFT
ncbi:MAG TPA: 16S rRNA (guanine(527)-N(7))-methyltransferase RsmG [Candidatus Binatia bacterium]|nr:16S rRNA (guanine(527)-N(7))-methyltransferase RsmG [Candidatus Binatia bacterium]